jgi:hypothetical protein
MPLVNQSQTQKRTKVSDPDENLEPEHLQVEIDREEQHLNPGYSEVLLVSSPSSQKQPSPSTKTNTNTKKALSQQHPRISSLLSSSPKHRNSKTTSPKKISFAPSSDQTVVIANTSPNRSMPSYKNATLAKKRVNNFPDSIPHHTESPVSSMSADQEDNHHNPPSSLRTIRVFNHHHDGNPHPYAPQDRMEPRISPPSTQERALPKTSFPSSGLGKSGQIEARHCTRTIVFRNWSTQYWIHEYPVTIHLFDTMEDREVWSRSYWKRHPPASASASSPTSVMEFKDQDDDRQDLIQFSINFDTQGHLQKRMDKVERKRNKILGLDGNNKKISDEGKEYKDFQSNLVKKYVMEDVRSKYYSKSGPLMYVLPRDTRFLCIVQCMYCLLTFSKYMIDMLAKLVIWETEVASLHVRLEVQNQVN